MSRTENKTSFSRIAEIPLRLTALSAVLLLACVRALPPVLADEAQSLYKKIISSLDQDKSADAAAAYGQLRKNCPASPLLVQAELRLIETNKDYFNTLARYRAFLKDYPDFNGQDGIYYRLGQLYYIHNNFTEALTAFGTIISNYPSSPLKPASNVPATAPPGPIKLTTALLARTGSLKEKRGTARGSICTAPFVGKTETSWGGSSSRVVKVLVKGCSNGRPTKSRGPSPINAPKPSRRSPSKTFTRYVVRLRKGASGWR